MIKKIYNGRGYIFTGLMFGATYPLLRGQFQNEAIIAGMLIGGFTGLLMAPFHKTLDYYGPIYEHWMKQPKNYIRPIIISTIIVCAIFATHYLIFIA